MVIVPGPYGKKTLTIQSHRSASNLAVEKVPDRKVTDPAWSFHRIQSIVQFRNCVGERENDLVISYVHYHSISKGRGLK